MRKHLILTVVAIAAAVLATARLPAQDAQSGENRRGEGGGRGEFRMRGRGGEDNGGGRWGGGGQPTAQQGAPGSGEGFRGRWGGGGGGGPGGGQDVNNGQPAGVRGGWGGGQGGGPGGPGGGGPGGSGVGGGPGGGPGAGFANFDPVERLKRFDTNNNGMLEPSEIPDRMRPFIERAAQQAGLDPKNPMPIDKLADAYSQVRRERFAQQQQDDQSRAAGNSNPSNSSSSTANSTAAKPAGKEKPIERLVPGFGEQVDLPAVPGFGTQVALVTKPGAAANSDSRGGDKNGKNSGDSAGGDPGADDDLYYSSSAKSTAKSAAKSTSRVYRYLSPAERLPDGIPQWFVRADANGDGQVEMSEFATSWTADEAARFAKYDLNGDGVITPDEAMQVDKPAKK